MAIFGLVISTETAWEEWQRVSMVYSPFNVINFVVEFVLVSPAFGAYLWRERPRAKQVGVS